MKNSNISNISDISNDRNVFQNQSERTAVILRLLRLLFHCLDLAYGCLFTLIVFGMVVLLVNGVTLFSSFYDNILKLEIVCGLVGAATAVLAAGTHYCYSRLASAYIRRHHPRFSSPDHGATIEEVVVNLCDEPVEFSAVFSSTGEKVAEYTNYSTYMVATPEEFARNNVCIHNHPTIHNTCLSDSDIMSALESGKAVSIAIDHDYAYIFKNNHLYENRFRRVGLFYSIISDLISLLCAVLPFSIRLWLSDILALKLTARRFGFKFSVKRHRPLSFKSPVILKLLAFAAFLVVFLAQPLEIDYVTRYSDYTLTESYRGHAVDLLTPIELDYQLTPTSASNSPDLLEQLEQIEQNLEPSDRQ